MRKRRPCFSWPFVSVLFLCFAGDYGMMAGATTAKRAGSLSPSAPVPINADDDIRPAIAFAPLSRNRPRTQPPSNSQFNHMHPGNVAYMMTSIRSSGGSRMRKNGDPVDQVWDDEAI
jgi:hypothetical protein